MDENKEIFGYPITNPDFAYTKDGSHSSHGVHYKWDVSFLDRLLILFIGRAYFRIIPDASPLVVGVKICRSIDEIGVLG